MRICYAPFDLINPLKSNATLELTGLALNPSKSKGKANNWNWESEQGGPEEIAYTTEMTDEDYNLTHLKIEGKRVIIFF